MDSQAIKARAARLVPVGAALLVTLGLAACGGGGKSSSEGKGAAAEKAPSNTLRVAVEQSPEPFDPATLGDNRSIELAQNVFDGLTAINQSNGLASPGIAESWKVSANGKVYTFDLRSGVKFQNGDPVTAQDFVYSWNRTLSPKTASPYLFFLSGIEGAEAVSSGKAKAASGIKAINSRTLQVTLSAPAGYFPELVSRWPFWVVDPKVVAADGAKWDTPPDIIGSGPYRLTNQVGDTEYDFTSNPSYFAGAPSIKQVKVSVVPNPTSRVARYEAGEFDAVFGLASAALRQVEASSTLKQQLHIKQQLGTTWLGMNNTAKPFDNAKVREAFSDAIDRASMVKVALDGLGKPTGTFLPPGLPGAIANTSEASKYGKYDPTEAKKLLEEAGYSGGKGFPNVTLETQNTASDEAITQFIQAELAQNLGIQVGLKAVPQNAFNAAFENPKTAPILYIYNFSLDYPDAQEMLQYFTTSGPEGFVNYQHYENASYNTMIEKAIATTNSTQRANEYLEAEKLFMSTEPVVPLYNQEIAWLAKPYAKGVGQNSQYMEKWDRGTLVGAGG